MAKEPVRIASLKFISTSVTSICKKLSEKKFVEITEKNEIYNPLDIVPFTVPKPIKLIKYVKDYVDTNITNRKYSKDMVKFFDYK